MKRKSRFKPLPVVLTGLALAAGFNYAAHHVFSPNSIENIITDPQNDNLMGLTSNEITSLPEVAPVIVRPLTLEEKRLAQALFGYQLDTSDLEIRLYNNPQASYAPRSDAMYLVEGHENIILVNGQQNYEHDFALTRDIDNYGVFVRYLSFIWQEQNNIAANAAVNDGYLYELNQYVYKPKPFESYNRLQQSAIIEDVARRFFHTQHDALWSDIKFGERRCHVDWALERLVSENLPAAESSMLAFEKAATRNLTEAEKNLVFGIFGTQINAEDLQIYLSPISCTDTAASVSDNYIMTMYGSYYHSSEYTQSYGYQYGTFIHESTHNWQRQVGFSLTNEAFVNNPDPYAYPLDLNRWSFEDYGTEQQAEIIEDYSLIALNRSGTSSNFNNRAALITLVENQFPQAKVTREYFETYGHLPSYTRP